MTKNLGFFLEKIMNQSKYPVTNYVPYNPNNYLTESSREHSLGDTLDRQKYEKIVNNPSYHFTVM